MKKRGFTLIELLAVIVILAIIALISVPIVINIINDTKTSSEKESVELYIDSVKKAMARKQLEKNNFNPATCEIKEDGNLLCDDVEVIVEMKGAKPIKGIIEFSNEKINEETTWLKMSNSNYYSYKNNKIKKLIEEEIKYLEIKLPEEYKEVEYIESTGSQYINTKLSANEYDNISVEIYGKYTASTKYSYIFSSGYYNSDEDSSFILMGQTNEMGIIMQYGKAATEKKVKDFDTDNHIWYLDLAAKQGKLDSTVVNLDGNIIKFNYNYYLFSEYTNGTACNKAKFRMNYCKIKNERNQFIRYYIPCYTNTTVLDVDGIERPKGTIGMYDLTEGKFYVNKGSGNFIKGSDIN